MDTKLGCRMWDLHPAPKDKVTWTGTCRAGAKMGRGVLQWLEHGRAVDRFEGVFVSGHRHGHGRYVWNQTDWYDGLYENDFPHGQGAAHIAGELFVGQWTRGCLKQGAKVVAIGLPREACEKHEQRIVGGTATRRSMSLECTRGQ
jgi:hypothetical protein